MATATPQDEGFHEIQLNGKQLVFLFMAATVVSVVIFLCGVLVGRGVRAERTATAESAAGDVPTADITPTQPPTAAASSAAASDLTTAAPPPAQEDLSYFKRLEDPTQPQEHLKPAQKPAPSPAPVTAPPSSAPQSAAPPAPASASASGAPPKTAEKSPAAAQPASTPKDANAKADLRPPSTPGYAVQVAALNARGEAEAIAKRLAAKGYSAYVSSNGSPSIYRVRIGTFKTRREADTVAAKLQREEQMKPWVTR